MTPGLVPGVISRGRPGWWHTDPVTGTDRARRPFWLHQAAEYLVGVALIAQGLQAAEPWVPAVAGAVIMINAAIAKGPLGAFAFVGRRLHRTLDLVIIVGLAVAAVAPGVELSMRFILGAFAVVLGFVARYTRYDSRPSVRTRFTEGADATPGDRAEELGRRWGRAAGQGVKAWKQRR